MPFRVRVKDRSMEWLVASYTTVFGIWLAAPEASLNPTTLALVLKILPEQAWAIIFNLVGAVHLLALAINGSAWWTPHVRAIAASTNLIAYTFLTVSIWYANPWSSAVPTYGYFVIGSLLVVLFRALRDSFLKKEIASNAA